MFFVKFLKKYFYVVWLLMPATLSFQLSSMQLEKPIVKKEAIILYSGGLDSSAVVAKLADSGYTRLHLLTCDNGAQDHIDYSQIKLEDFKRQFTMTDFIHVICPVKYLFKELALRDIEEDIPTYKTNLLCVGCKMAMHAEAMVYALKNNIHVVADGFAKRQEGFPEQDSSFLEKMRRIYGQYGLQNESPLYEIAKSKQEVKKILFRYNLSTKSIEPGCLFGDTFSKASTESVKAYFEKKTPMMCKYIDECIKK